MVNGKVAEEVFYLTDTVNMLQVILIIKTRTMIIKLYKNYENGQVGLIVRVSGCSSPLSARKMCSR